VIIDPMETSVQRRSPNRRKKSKMSSLLSRQKPQRLVLVERLVDDEARRIVRTERLRLAQELQDIISYGFATIALQARVATHVAETKPERTVDALHVICDASRDVLAEIRAMLCDHEPGRTPPGAAGARPHLSVVREKDARELTTPATVRRKLPIYEVDERDAS
jgi:signal transduction histidine kinase